MELLGTIIFIICLTGGFISLFFGFPGTLVILAATLIYALLTGFSVITGRILCGLTLIYLAGEGLEYLLVLAGARKFGASRAGVAGAIGGGILGALLGACGGGLGLVPGTLLGIFLGASLAEFTTKRDLRASLKAGVGGLSGRVSAIALKVIIALGMLLVIIPRLF
jgi:uncharacterized protein YqgC (DUF456 family)